MDFPFLMLCTFSWKFQATGKIQNESEPPPICTVNNLFLQTTMEKLVALFKKRAHNIFLE